MRDCSNAEMRDLLPDVLHGRVSPAERAEVDAHLAACAACREELALLTRIRSAAPAPAVNVHAIAQALPAYRAARSARTWPLLRIAAGLVLVAGVTTLVARNGQQDSVLLDTVAQGPSAVAPVLSLGESIQDLSDSDLAALASELTALDGVLSAEPEEIVVPLSGESGS